MNKYEESAKNLRNAMKGLGTDEAVIIEEVSKHTNKERQLIKEKYMSMYGKALEEDIKSEISGNFLKNALGLLDPIRDFEAKCLRKAMDGAGTNEKILIQTICPKSADEINELKISYKKIFNRDLEKDIASEVSGDFGLMMKSLVSCGRPLSGTVDYTLAAKEAKELYSAGEGRLGTDESEFIRILCSRSFKQLNATFMEYDKISKNGIEKAIIKETSGNFEEACLAIVKSVRNINSYYAEILYKAMKGLGTDDETLTRILVSRSGIDLNSIKMEYALKYKVNLYDAVQSETSGDYRKLLLNLIGK